MNRALLKTSIKYGLRVASLTLAAYLLLGAIVRQFLNSWRPMDHYVGMMLGLFIGTWFFHTWIRYGYLKKRKKMKDVHDTFITTLEIIEEIEIEDN